MNVALFMKLSAKRALNILISLKCELNSRQNEGTITLYCETVTYLFETFATDDVATKTNLILSNELRR